MTPALDRNALERAFAQIGDRAVADHRVVEIAVYGGAALILTLEGRAVTKDLDAVIKNDAPWLRSVAAGIALENGWPEDWLNDGVKGFLSAKDADPDSRRLFRTFPSEQQPGLRVFVAAPAYLFAMKCLAMRLGGAEVSQDRSDIEMLAKVLGVVSAGQAIALVARYYPANRISSKTQFGIEEIFGAPA